MFYILSTVTQEWHKSLYDWDSLVSDSVVLVLWAHSRAVVMIILWVAYRQNKTQKYGTNQNPRLESMHPLKWHLTNNSS